MKSGLERMTDSLDTIMRTLRELEAPLCESRRLLPRANRQLDKISTQTEAAARRMLDKIELVIENQNEIARLCKRLDDSPTLSGDDGGNVRGVSASRIRDLAESTRNEAFLIVDALQFQDIASEDTEHAAEMLENVEHRLHRLQNLIADAAGVDNCPDEARSTAEFETGPIETSDQKEVDSLFSKISSEHTR